MTTYKPPKNPKCTTSYKPRKTAGPAMYCKSGNKKILVNRVNKKRK